MNPKLINAIKKQLQVNEQNFRETLQSVIDCGADGFSNFIYDKPPIKFFDANEGLILEELKDLALSFGEDPLILMATEYIRSSKKLTTLEIAEAIFKKKSEYGALVKNALTWFAIEQVAKHALSIAPILR